jgi:hypothetical protein
MDFSMGIVILTKAIFNSAFVTIVTIRDVI